MAVHGAWQLCGTLVVPNVALFFWSNRESPVEKSCECGFWIAVRPSASQISRSIQKNYQSRLAKIQTVDDVASVALSSLRDCG